MSLVIAKTYPDTLQANIAKGLLESYGIASTIMHEQFHTTYSSAFGNVPLMVDEQVLIQAQELLARDLSDSVTGYFSA